MKNAVTRDDVSDIVYVRLREGRIAATKAFGDDRLVDVDADGAVLGVEFIGIGNQLDLRGLPAQADLLFVVEEQVPSCFEVLTDLAGP
ncbi:MAG: DUF2283 domain-containing protein [Chloroflexi bacterium]|nr:DUF2283 domain-containing protein [Chloroflexota bacterium]